MRRPEPFPAWCVMRREVAGLARPKNSLRLILRLLAFSQGDPDAIERSDQVAPDALHSPLR